MDDKYVTKANFVREIANIEQIIYDEVQQRVQTSLKEKKNDVVAPFGVLKQTQYKKVLELMYDLEKNVNQQF